MHRKLLWLRIVLSVTICLAAPGLVLAQAAHGEPPRTRTVTFGRISEADRELLANHGISITATAEGMLTAPVTDGQLRALRESGIRFGLVKPAEHSEAQQAAQSGSLSNEHLTLSLNNTGQFTMSTADGRYLLYPQAGTGFLSVKVDSRVYNNDDGSLYVETPVSFVDANTAYIRYRTPENVLITQRFTLRGQAVQFEVEAVNQGGVRRDVSVRYLLDTQVDENDGSPLYAPSVGVRVLETDIPLPSFTTWRGYDLWPNPTLASQGTLSTPPDRMVFAWWPQAVRSDWGYTPDAGQRFYTPGYTTSPESDSCVLVYFDVGSLGAGMQRTIATYYGIGAPTAQADRELLISTFDDLREAVKSSMEADLDAFAGLQAKYIVTMRTDWRDYLEAAWSVVSLVASPEPSDVAKLGKDAEMLEKIAKIVGLVEGGTDVALGLGDLLDSIPSSASHYQVKNNYIYPRFASQVQIGPYAGVGGALDAVDEDYEDYVQQIPNPLPVDYPVNEMVAFMQQQIAALNASKSGEAWVMGYHSDYCSLGKFGVLQAQEESMEDLAEQVELAENVSFSATLAEIGIFVGAGALKIAGIVGAPVTAGGSTVVLIPTEAYLWGSAAAIAAVPSIIGGVSTAAGLTAKGALTQLSYEAMAQLPNDLEMRRAVLQGTGEWLAGSSSSGVQKSQLLNESPLQVESISIPDVIVAEEEIAGQGTGRVVVKNTGSSTVNVGIYGSITTELDKQMPIVGLTGSAPVAISPGQRKTIEFSSVVLRSALLHRTGYDAHLMVTEASPRRVVIQGPFESHFFAGTNSQLAVLTDQTFKTIARGTLETGRVVNTVAQFAADTESGRLILSFPEGSDQDLHLYDKYGRHVGLNYATGEVETEIPDVNYSGPNAWPEWMTVKNPATDPYQVNLVAQDTGAGDGYDLSKLETGVLSAMLDSPTQVGWQIMRPDPQETIADSFALQISEGGGSQDITQLRVTPSDFGDGQGHVIPASNIVCTAPSQIPAGRSVMASCRFTIYPHIAAGNYSGTLTVTGRDHTAQTLATHVDVTMKLAEPRHWDYVMRLPVIMKDFQSGTELPTPTRTPIATLTPTRTPTSTPTRTRTPTATPTLPPSGPVEITVSTAGGHQLRPAVAWNPNQGEYLVVWQEREDNADIYAQRVSASGDLRGSKIAVSTASLKQQRPAVAYDSQRNEYLVVWQSGTGEENTSGYNYIHGQRLSGSGGRLGGLITVSAATNWQVEPDVAYNSRDDQYLVVWRDGTVDVHGQRISGSGALLGSNFRICGAPRQQNRPSVVYNSVANEFFVAWDDHRNNVDYDIYGCRVSATGIPYTDVEICRQGGDQLAPEVGFCPITNEYLVAWPDYSVEPTQLYPDLFATRITQSGLVRPRFALSTAQWGQLDPAIAFNPVASEYLVVWTNNRPWDIHGQRLSPSGSFLGSSVMFSTDSEKQHLPAIAVNTGSGGHLIAWEDWRSQRDFDIYAYVQP